MSKFDFISTLPQTFSVKFENISITNIQSEKKNWLILINNCWTTNDPIFWTLSAQSPPPLVFVLVREVVWNWYVKHLVWTLRHYFTYVWALRHSVFKNTPSLMLVLSKISQFLRIKCKVLVFAILHALHLSIHVSRFSLPPHPNSALTRVYLIALDSKGFGNRWLLPHLRVSLP